MISEQQVDYISRQVESSNIRSKELIDDLIDHFCCLVEIEMSRGTAFEKAYQKAYEQTSPNGLDEIQNETLFLFNYQKLKTMKMITFGLGYLFTLALSTGCLFKILHLPGAGVLLLSGLTGLAFVFAPLFLVNQFKSLVGGLLSERLKFIFGTLGLMMVSAGTWLKLTHSMGGGLILAIGFFVIGFGYFPFLFFRMAKASNAQIA